MEFEREYFENEVKDGFLVPSPIKHAWAAQLEVLSDIDVICRKHGIQYFAEWGTLLGAVRHHGYIPWDDDLDICMKRSDYRRFLEVAPGELPKGYYLNNFHLEDGFTDYMTRIVNEHRISFEKEHLEKFHQFPFVTGIDLFVLDFRAPEEALEEKQIQMILETAEKISSLTAELEKTGAELGVADHILCQERNAVYQSALSFLQRTERETGISVPEQIPLLRRLFCLSEEIMALYSDEETYPDPQRITLMPLWVNGRTYDFPSECYGSTVELPFESMTVPVPVRYDAVLRKKYGQYWQLVRKGSSHGYPYFKVQEDIVNEHFGRNGQWFPFEEARAGLEKKEKTKRPSFAETATGLFGLVKQFQALLEKMVREGADETVLQILPHGQELAVKLGTFMEGICWRGNSESLERSCMDAALRAVKSLEDYCELLFALSGLLTGNLQTVLTAMADTLSLTGRELETLVCVKRILFLLDSPKELGCVKHLMELHQAQGCQVQCIFLPYYIKKQGGVMEGPFLDKEGCPEWVRDLDAMNYQPLEQMPDVIYFCNPYDGCSPERTVETKFHSGLLLGAAKQMVYVPPFSPQDFEPEDERSVKNQEYYVTVPGAAYADKVVVGTDCLRSRYLEKLTGWSGEEWKGCWEKKLTTEEEYCSSLGAAGEEQTGLKPARKKTIAFFVADSAVLGQPRYYTKIQDCLRIFSENRRSVRVLWIRDSLIESIAGTQPEKEAFVECREKPEAKEAFAECREKLEEKETFAECREKLEQLQKEFQALGIGELCGEKEFLQRIDEADAFYGDPGFISTQMIVRKKPVMIMNAEV